MTIKKPYIYLLFFIIIDFLFYKKIIDIKDNFFIDLFVVLLSLLKLSLIVFVLRKKKPWTSFLKYNYQTNQFTVLDKDSYIDYFKNINQFKALVDQEINITYE